MIKREWNCGTIPWWNYCIEIWKWLLYKSIRM